MKWNKTRIFNWRASNSIAAAFQDTLIILFQCILFYSYFNIALNFLHTERVSSFINVSVSLMGCSVSCLLQSGGQWLAAIFWRWKLLSWELFLALMTCHMAVCPDDHRAAPGFQHISSSVQRALPHLFQHRNVSRKKWPARLSVFLSITDVCSELWPTAACGGQAVEWFSGMFPHAGLN